jgi:TatD DNase family protein
MLRGKRGRDLVARMPRDRVLTESDGPFAQLENRAAMPSDINVALKYLGDIWSMGSADVHQTMIENFRTLVAVAER